MIDFLSLDNKCLKKSPPISLLTNFESIDMECAMVNMTIRSNQAKFTVIEPMVSKYSLGISYLFKENLSLLIPLEESIGLFIATYLDGYLADICTSDNNEILQSLYNLIIITLIKNVGLLLNSHKSNDNQPEKVLSQNIEHH